MSSSDSARSFGRFDPRSARARLLLAFIVGATTFVLTPDSVALATRIVAAWDAFAAALIAVVVWVVTSSNATETRRRASAYDPGRTVVWLLVLVCTTFSLFASAVVLRRAKSMSGDEGHILSALCLVAVSTSWLLAHLGFTLRYAHLFYRDKRGEGGIDFPGNERPDDFDFAYFAFTLGMCFQVSDTAISARAIRRTALVHAVLSFAYNTVILALALNLMFGLLG